MRITQLIPIFFCCVLTGCGTDQTTTTAEMPAIPVIAHPPIVKDITTYIDSIGTLHPSMFLEVRAQVNGILDKVFVTEGQELQTGTPLFSIEPTYYSIKVREAQAQLAMDEADFLNIKKKMDRYRDLFQKELISKTEWEELETQLAKAQAAVDCDQARLITAKLDLEHCTVKSSITGSIGKLDLHPGLLINEGQTDSLATISQMDPLIVEFKVTEKEYAKLLSDNRLIEIHPLCSNEISKQGTITFVDNHFDPKTGLLLIRAQMDNGDKTLRPGQSVRVRIPVSVTSAAKMIPQKAIRYNQSGPYVYVVQSDNTVASRQLVLGDELDSDQIVLQGIDNDEQIITDGHLRLAPGSKVEIKS